MKTKTVHCCSEKEEGKGKGEEGEEEKRQPVQTLKGHGYHH